MIENVSNFAMFITTNIQLPIPSTTNKTYSLSKNNFIGTIARQTVDLYVCIVKKIRWEFDDAKVRIYIYIYIYISLWIE